MDLLDKFLIFLLVCFVIALGYIFAYQTDAVAERAGLSKTVGIILSNSCITQLEANMLYKCPSYDAILELGLDTSKKESGEFETENGITRRGKPLFKNHFRLYDFDNDWNIIVDPDGEMASRIKLIHIESNFNSYFANTDFDKINHTRTIHINRYVENCSIATLDSKIWFEGLADTIFYLRSGCKPTHTAINETITIYDPITEHDISTSRDWQHKQWLKEALKNATENRIGKD